MNQVKELRITLCTFRTVTSSPAARSTEFVSNYLQQLPLRKSRARKVKSGGSDPTLFRTIRPRVPWGRLPPPQALRVDDFRGCICGSKNLSDRMSDIL